MAFIAGFLLLFVTFSISYSIFSRTVGLTSPVWIVQFNEYALLWITFLGTAWVLARDKHVSIDLLTGRFSQEKKSYLKLFHGILGTIVCLVLLWYGFWTTLGQFQRGIIDVQAVDVPKFLILMIIPIGFLFLVIQFMRQFFNTLKRVGKETEKNDSVDEQNVSIHQGFL
jgi:TRAP-type C4-dicarboxylate transport system permease small subunit